MTSHEGQPQAYELGRRTPASANYLWGARITQRCFSYRPA
jgi:hypothetical protein